MQPHIITLVVALICEASALTDVHPKLLTPSGDCRHWPTGRSMLVVDSAEDSAIDGLPAQPYDIVFPSKILPLLSIDLRASRGIAKTTLSCDAGQAILASEPSKKISICQDRENGHILVDGVEQDGVYLGVKGQTTWGFRYAPASCYANATISTRDYYEVKLLGLPESEYDTIGYVTEFRGFLKIVKWE
jgi:hypothetical protein